MAVLKSGFVLAGTLPTTYDNNGNVTSIGPGSLLVLNSDGTVVKTLTDSTLLDSPWFMTTYEAGSSVSVFVSNVQSGTVVRMDLQIVNGNVDVLGITRIGSGYTARTDPAALVVGPAGLTYDVKTDTLFVASTGDNAIYAIPHARTNYSLFHQGKGTLVVNDPTHLNGPIGLALAPNGDLIVTNGDVLNPAPTTPSAILEYTRSGRFVGEYSLERDRRRRLRHRVEPDGQRPVVRGRQRHHQRASSSG